MERFYGHGKLLLTGEYAVLDGALALALPTQLGQSLEIELKEDKGLHWKSLDPDGAIWFEGSFHQGSTSQVVFEGDSEIGRKLASILSTALRMRQDQHAFQFQHKVTTRLDFYRNWGLGSSSTLIHVLSQWLEVDPYALLFDTMGGSGYDVACASADGPLLYQLTDREPTSTRVDFDPVYKDELCFVFLGRKQKSSEAIEHYRKHVKQNPEFLETVSSISKEVLNCASLQHFEQLMLRHEDLLSDILQLPRIQERFPDYPGVLKSLGAWGGDFILATRSSEAKEYFKKKGLTPVIPFSEMIL